MSGLSTSENHSRQPSPPDSGTVLVLGSTPPVLSGSIRYLPFSEAAGLPLLRHSKLGLFGAGNGAEKALAWALQHPNDLHALVLWNLKVVPKRPPSPSFSVPTLLLVTGKTATHAAASLLQRLPGERRLFRISFGAPLRQEEEAERFAHRWFDYYLRNDREFEKWMVDGL